MASIPPKMNTKLWSIIDFNGNAIEVKWYLWKYVSKNDREAVLKLYTDLY